MKKNIYISVILLVFTLSLKAQDFKNAIKINTLVTFIGQYQFSYERAIDSSFSIQLSAGVISRSLNWNVTENGTTSNRNSQSLGFIIVPEARYYTNNALNGFYLAGFLRYRQVSNYLESSSNSNTIIKAERRRTSSGGGILLGYQETIGKRILLDIYAGPQYVSIRNNLISGDSDLENRTTFRDRNGPGFRLGINLGILI